MTDVSGGEGKLSWASVVSPVITGHDVFGAVDKHPLSAIGLISREDPRK